VRLVSTLRAVFGVQTGISDHSLDPVLVPSLAVCEGAKIIEKHITLSREAGGLDDPVALTPDAFKTMTLAVRQAEIECARFGAEYVAARLKKAYGDKKITRILGDGVKMLAPAERQNYGRTNRSLHYLCALKKGDVIQRGDIAVLRTEKILTPGISPRFFSWTHGKRLAKDVSDGEGVQLDDFVKIL
jgi:sialic acid synthase SpsE